jgi:hypothetical protein
MARVQAILFGPHDGQVVEIPTADAYILSMYARSRSLLHGVSVLLDAGMPEEAMILARELFSDSLILKAIAGAGEARGALLLGMRNDGLTDLQNLERQALNLGLRSEQHFNEVGDMIAAERAKVERYRVRNGIAGYGKLPDEKQLAKSQGRVGEYLDYQFAHRMVHRADFAQAMRTTRGDDDIVRVFLQTPDPEFAPNVAAVAMTAALHAHLGAAAVFGWAETSVAEIDELLRQIDDEFGSTLPAGDEAADEDLGSDSEQ